MTARLQLVRRESAAEHIRNGLQIAQLTKAYEMPPADVERNLLAIEARLMRALNELEPKPIQGVPFFTGRDGAA